MRRNSQSGFTLIELMMSSMVVGFLTLSASTMMVRAFSWYDEASSKIKINQQARAAFNIVGNGGTATTAGNDGTLYVYGFRGKNIADTGGMELDYRLEYNSNNLNLTSDSFPEITIQCVSAGQPLPGCVGTEAILVKGWIAADLEVEDSVRSVVGRTAEVTFSIVDPFQVQRAENGANFSETYRHIFTLNQTHGDP
jgi:prepilin-type N-terminal cleavage/methylation domain-containing protein